MSSDKSFNFFFYIKNFCCAEVELIRELRNENEIPMKAKIYLKLFFMWCRFDFSLKSFFCRYEKNTNKSSFCIYDRKIYYKEYNNIHKKKKMSHKMFI